MKTITIAGNIGKNAETRRTQDGTAVTSWSVAVEDRTGRERRTEWFDVSLWGSRGEKLAEYLTKGSRVVVTGDLGRREYEGKTYLTVRADQVTLMGGGERSEGYSESRQAPAQAGPHELDDLIPFAPEWRG